MKKEYKPKEKFYRYISFFTFLLSSVFLTSCASFKPKASIEMVYPPVIPKDYKSPPPEIQNFDNNFTKLKDSKTFSQNIDVGRSDPFMPPRFKKEKMIVPPDFKFSGVINANGQIIALVSNDNNNGALSIGDVGGVDTDLIPDGWVVKMIFEDIPRLQLKYLNKKLNIDL